GHSSSGSVLRRCTAHGRQSLGYVQSDQAPAQLVQGAQAVYRGNLSVAHKPTPSSAEGSPSSSTMVPRLRSAYASAIARPRPDPLPREPFLAGPPRSKRINTLSRKE